MDHNLLLALGALLTIPLLTGLVAFAKVGHMRRLRERIARASATEGRTTLTAELPSIRLQTHTTPPIFDRLLRLLRYNPDIPHAQAIPWWATVVIGLLSGGVGGYYLFFLISWWGAVMGGTALALAVIRSLFAWQYNRYRSAIFEQIPDAISLMVRAIRAGLPIGEAMRSVAAEASEPLRGEFARLLGEIAIGRPVDQALMRLHHRTGLTEFSFLAVTLGLQSQTGGNLAETLDNLADIVRKRVALAKRAKALAAEARMQAGILMVLPYLAALAMSQIQPFYIDNFLRNPTGQKLALIGLGFSFFGYLVIRWMIKRAGTD